MRRNIGYAADLVEWYRVVSGGPMRRQFLGQWSRPGRFIISNEDLWQRRRDLEGLQLNVDTVEVSVLLEVLSCYFMMASGLRERRGKVKSIQNDLPTSISSLNSIALKPTINRLVRCSLKENMSLD
jgi:hypothetical protein